MESSNSTSENTERMLKEMIAQQHQKLLKLSQEIIPDITPEDMRNPQDFPELINDPIFNYEDGILTGYLSVQMALRPKPSKPSL